MAQTIYKICQAEDWAEALASGQLDASPDDARDGFIHLSAPGQVHETAAKHFRHQEDLVLVAFDTEPLAEALKWEPSRGGDLFPHYYGSGLPTSAALSIAPLPLDTEGAPIIPPLDGATDHEN